MNEKVSPLAPAGLPDFYEVAGVSIATAATGIKYQGRDDLLLVGLDEGTVAAGIFTRSTAVGAPVVWCQQCLEIPKAGGLIVNAGNANVFTGDRGREDVRNMAAAGAAALQCKADEIFVASTGVIGEPLPIEKILPHLAAMQPSQSVDRWGDACRAILTTDTFAKGATRSVTVSGKEIRINGMAKGSGMIEPNMATMLAFVFTDANIDKSLLQELLVGVNEESFNAITVDSDTSTSDTCLLFATGHAGNDAVSDADSVECATIRKALAEVMLDLALQVVRDGEGASKLIQVRVGGASDTAQAKHVAKSIANSPLVKTAIAGEDANWGRVVMAIGKSGVVFDEQALQIAFGGIRITSNGMRADSYDESEVTRHLKGQQILIDVGLGIGKASASVWTCDLTHEYISINADYRS